MQKNILTKEEKECATTQYLVGMELIFKGWVVKNWLNANQSQSHMMKKLNKINVKYGVIFYSKPWIHRNEIVHDDEKFREFVIDWHKRIVSDIEKGNKLNMRRHMRLQKLDVKKCDMKHIKLWNESTMKMSKQEGQLHSKLFTVR